MFSTHVMQKLEIHVMHKLELFFWKLSFYFFHAMHILDS